VLILNRGTLLHFVLLFSIRRMHNIDYNTEGGLRNNAYNLSHGSRYPNWDSKWLLSRNKYKYILSLITFFVLFTIVICVAFCPRVVRWKFQRDILLPSSGTKSKSKEESRIDKNYTYRATAACRRNWCQLLRIEGVAWSAQRIPTADNLDFLDPEPLHFHSSSSSVIWVYPVTESLFLRKSVSVGNRTRDLWICSQELWPIDHRDGLLNNKL
jgi:hypothetical protein